MKWVHRIFAIVTVGPFVIWGFAIVSVIILSLGFDCRIDEGNIYPCNVLGRDLGRTANTLGFWASWGLMLFATFSMCAGLAWGLVAIIAAIVRRRRARG